MKTPEISLPSVRTANKAELAAFFDTSLPTVEAWMRKGCPYVQQGSRGVPWIFDLRAVAEWRYGRAEVPGEVDPSTLPPADRKAWYESEIKRRDLQVGDRELIESAEVERGIATAFATISQAVRAIPDSVDRVVSPGIKVIEAIERITDEALNALADQLAKLSSVGVESEAE